MIDVKGLEMQVLRKFFIYGRPIKTEIGLLHFMTVREYYDFIKEGYLSTLLTTKEDVLKSLKLFEQLDENIKYISDTLREMNLFDFLKLVKEIYEQIEESKKETSYVYRLGLYGLYLNFKKMFEFCFKEDVFDKISSNEEFEIYRDLICEINCIDFERPNPNPEIERFNQMRRLMQKNKGESIDFESMYTSVGLAFGKDPDDMTLYKFHKYFARLAQFKNHDTTVLFRTVDNNVKIEPWYKIIEEKKKQLQTISEDMLKRNNPKEISDYLFAQKSKLKEE